MPPGNNPKPRSQPLPPSSYNYPLGPSCPFPQPRELPTIPFFKVISERKSVRCFHTMNLLELSTLLAYTARVRMVKVTDDGSILSHRFTASAGGVHPIDLLFSLPASIAIRQLFYYNPFFHQYVQLELPQVEQQSFFEHVNESLPLQEGVLIWMLANSYRTEAHYENPESLVWRDAGALLNAIQLTATALNCTSCGIGTLAEPFIQRLFNDRIPVISAGGLLIGKASKLS